MKTCLLALGALSVAFLTGCGGSEPTVKDLIPAQTDIVLALHGLDKDLTPARNAWAAAIAEGGDAETAATLLAWGTDDIPDEIKPLTDALRFSPATLTIGASSYVTAIDAPVSPQEMPAGAAVLLDPAIDLNALIEAVKPELDKSVTITQEGDWTKFAGSTPGRSLGVRKVEGLGVHISSTAAAPEASIPADSPLTAALIPVEGSDRSVVLVVNDFGKTLGKALDDYAPRSRHGEPTAKEQLQAFCPALLEAKSLYTALSLKGADLTLTVRVTFPDEAKAQEAGQILAGIGAMMRLFMQGTGLTALNPMLEKIKPVTVGNDVTQSLTFTTADYVTLCKELDAEMERRNQRYRRSHEIQ